MRRRRILWLGAALAPLLVGNTGCRLLEDRPRLFGRNDRDCESAKDVRAARDPRDCDPCNQGFPASLSRPPAASPYSVPSPTTNFSSVASPVLGSPSMPSSWSIGPSYPVYPVGQPVILPSTGVASPANELPYPTITPPGVPEGPSSAATTPTALTGGKK